MKIEIMKPPLPSSLLPRPSKAVTFPHTVTPYRDSVDGTRDHVTLRACSVCCRYLTVASKG